MRIVAISLVLAVNLSAFGGQCESNYRGSGSSFRGGKLYETTIDAPSVTVATVLQRIAERLPADSFEVSSTDLAAGKLLAIAKLSSGRTADVVVMATPTTHGTRIHFAMQMPAGAVGTSATKSFICRELASATEATDPASRHPLVNFVRANREDARVGTVESGSLKRVAKVATGVVIGMAAGAVHAQKTGGDVKAEALIGGVGGGAVAFAVTKLEDRRLAGREDVVKAVAYEPNQGYTAGITELDVEPKVLRPGGTLTVTVTYWALAPDPKETFEMYRYAGLALGDTYLRGFRFVPEPFDFPDGGGQYRTVMTISLPEKVSPGTYTLQWVFEGSAANADRALQFTVTG